MTQHPQTYPKPAWLENARFYEVYPQSFADSNGDGIGDIPGITGKLDYIAALGCNALWINPCFDSPFKDAGYDVRDYTQVAPRYGTNDDLIVLFEAAHQRDMHVLLDLVPGHTSEEHHWFQASSRPNPAERTIVAPSDGPSRKENTGGVFRRGLDDSRAEKQAEGSVIAGRAVGEADWGRDQPTNVSNRYIWTDSWIAGGDGLPFIGGETERDGTYILNFFKCQPALNYGFAHPHQAWQKPALGPDALATCDAMVDIMRFWLARGADGFRVDMADSLVKHDDAGKPYTIRTWQYMFSKIRPEFPEAAFVAEWGRPNESMQAGFDMDFYLDWRWDGHPNGYNLLLRNTDTPMEHEGDSSYFNADSGASIAPFLAEYLPQLTDCRAAGGHFNLISCNHDTLRTAQRLTERELKVAYGMLLTMPGCPFLYYGDEIGMRYRALPTKEGGYVRTGSRTPMQWASDTPNLGFSTAPADALYLPTDPADDAPTVTGEASRPRSLFNWIRSVLALRAAQPALTADAGFSVVAAPADGRAFAYLRTAEPSVSTAHSTKRADAVDHTDPVNGLKAASGSTGDGTAARPLLIAMNPGRHSETVDLPNALSPDATMLLSLGEPVVGDGQLTLSPQSFAVLG
ncbi:alpha amylase catalytic subunit [Bifidobacterium reuteri DSM 23975]|uniref:Alpha amylase catalytic subunit n=1 Tax=Bifidobacterium reuteri DSM 23975 TaxID=1437610 RepID=A0A087CY93_9BIFI|nr:alpha-amylase family glycosyl hydrolase [Bifidobacterium reuteri]KFI88243.1 alpha amylase catalytic subunit [Bifidobacterium reuteri DSM 23975]